MSQIKPGDLIRTENGWVPVKAVEDTGQYETVYNLAVEDFHTYFVGSPEWGFAVWAHNAECVNPEGLRKTAGVDENVAKVAVRKLRMENGEQLAYDYLISKHITPEVARQAIEVGMAGPPARASIVPVGEDPRLYYMGRTPRINEGPGKQVFARMEQEGHVVYDVKTREPLIRSTDPVTGEVGWYKLSQSQMGHKIDAVHWWNQEGRFFPRPGGRPAPEVRAWMQDPNNYVIEFQTHNAAKGAMTKNAGHRYLNPSLMSLPVITPLPRASSMEIGWQIPNGYRLLS